MAQGVGRSAKGRVEAALSLADWERIAVCELFQELLPYNMTVTDVSAAYKCVIQAIVPMYLEYHDRDLSIAGLQKIHPKCKNVSPG